MQNYIVAVCGNTIYFPLFLISTILYKFVLHIIGLVLIFLTRNVEVDVLNDSKYLPATIYCSAILLITSCMTLYIVSKIQNVVEITWAIFISIMITVFLGFNYIPKVSVIVDDLEYYKKYIRWWLYTRILKENMSLQQDRTPLLLQPINFFYKTKHYLLFYLLLSIIYF